MIEHADRLDASALGNVYPYRLRLPVLLIARSEALWRAVQDDPELAACTLRVRSPA